MTSKQVDMVFAGKEVVKSYVQFRPVPPQALISRILEFTKEKKLLIDVGCGSGQTTELFASHFEKVIGLDVSPEQLKIARAKNSFPNVIYKEGPAESLPSGEETVDLVTACVSVHWFDFKKFYAEVDRVLKPGGVLACCSYIGCSPLYGDKNLRKEFLEIWDSLAPYWPESHKHLRSEYSELPPCYPEDIHEKGFFVESEATLDTFLGYISSWSAFPKMKEAEGEVAAERFLQESKEKLLSALKIEEAVNPPMKRRYEYFLRLWRKPMKG